MSLDFKNFETEGVENTPKKIRSKYRLRLMNRLVERQETVGELAKLVGLRMPHASAEIKRMRGEKLVSSDLEMGSRGAKIRLTEKGRKVLQMDEWFKIENAFPLPHDKGKYCVLYREGVDVLFAFLQQPEEPLILVPDKLPNSKGNKGVSWNWAKLNEDGLTWFNLEKRSISVDGPNLIDPRNIESYSNSVQIVGVVRGRLIHEEEVTSIPIGEWFESPNFRPKPPLSENSYHRGNWTLGVCHHLSPDIRPKNPIVAIMNDNLYKSMLLRTAKRNTLLIGDLRGIDSIQSIYPIEVLNYWIEIAHPRISSQEKKKRLISLKEKISTKKRIKTSDSTWRKFRKDWNNVRFDDKKYSNELETRGLGKNAIDSIVQWSISVDKNLDLVIDLNERISSNTMLKLSLCNKLRLLIIGDKNKYFNDFDTLKVDTKRALPWLEFVTKRGDNLPFKLIEVEYQNRIEEEIINENITPWFVLGFEIENNFVNEKLDEEYKSVIMSSISQYPFGDESWANQMEARYPIAAWIASPDKGRWPRWQRLRKRIDPEWLALLNLDFLPIERIVEVSNEAPDSVLNLYSKKLKIKLRNDPDIFLRSRPVIESKNASRGVSWIAAQFLSNAPWMPDNIHIDMLDWAIDAWLRNPPIKSLETIRGVYWLYSKNNDDLIKIDELMHKLKNKNKYLNDNNDVKIWSNMLDMILKGKKLNEQEIRYIVNTMPSDWWAIESQEILLRAFKDDDLKWLLSIDLPWCSTILRPKGEKSLIPGLSSKPHPGCNFGIINELSKLKNSIISDSILDLYDSINNAINNNPPMPGKTHDLIGWLAQPIEKWPYFSIGEMLNGDKEVGERIIKKLSGYNNESLMN